jgi:hypothetical protein
MPLTDDLREAQGAPQTLFRSSEAPWSFELARRAPGSYVTDGPFMHRARDGGLFLLWSAFGKAGNYCIGAARSESGALRGRWLQSAEPIYEGGGHGMLFRSKEDVLYLAVHRPNETPCERAVFIAVKETVGAILEVRL